MVETLSKFLFDTQIEVQSKNTGVLFFISPFTDSFGIRCITEMRVIMHQFQPHRKYYKNNWLHHNVLVFVIIEKSLQALSLSMLPYFLLPSSEQNNF